MDEPRFQFVAQPCSKLLSLPAELRNHIYELVLTSRYLSIRRMRPERYDVSSQYRPTRCRSLDLLLTCRQVFTEAESIFYALNHLEYEAHSPLQEDICVTEDDFFIPSPTNFIFSLGSRRRAALRTVTLTSASMKLALDELEKCLLPLATNLHTLNMRLPLGTFITQREVVAWVSRVKVALRSTRVKEVKVRSSGPRSARARLFSWFNTSPLLVDELAQFIEEGLGSVLRN